MKMAGKTACLLFLVFISLFYANSLPAEEPFPAEESFLAEESFVDEYEYELFFEAPPLFFEAPVFELRSFNTIFPESSWEQRIMARTNEGFRHFFVNGESPSLTPNPDLGIELFDSIMETNPSHLIETLLIVPYNERMFDLLDIYNALGRIERIQDQSVPIRGNDVRIFTESTRIENSHNRRDIPDPLPATLLPFSETIYLRLRESNFGNLFLRGDISINMHSITYSMTNFTDIRHFFIPIMRAERFTTIIYLEPVKEGLLIYSMVGFYLPGFLADRINLTPNINRRIRIFINWITDGLREQERASQQILYTEDFND